MADRKLAWCVAGEFRGRMIEFPPDDMQRGIEEGWAIDPEGLDQDQLSKALDEADLAAQNQAYDQYVAETTAPADKVEEVKARRGRPPQTEEEKAAKAAAKAAAKEAADKAAKDAAIEAQRISDEKAARKAAKDAEAAAASGNDAATVAAIDAGVAANQGASKG